MTADETIYNPEAVIPPQCYTKTEGRHNPCFTCHQSYRDGRPNSMDDGALQGEYQFSDAGLKNHYGNLFEDRRSRIRDIRDRDILRYINQDNYTPLVDSLKQNPQWNGFIPDLANLHLGASAFDDHGLARDGSGWVAFNYIPMPSTFWPTNGSTDDVMVRLPAHFRQNHTGTYSRDIYFANLALLELAIHDRPATTLPSVDEQIIGVDLDGDGMLNTTNSIMRRDHYLGGAEEIPLTTMLYPEGTEFLHSVRYLGIQNEAITIPPRMKELRYLKKIRLRQPPALRSIYGNEAQEKIDENLPRWNEAVIGEGVEKGFGWLILGFIEDRDGALRKQSHEEHGFCIGCHSTIGTTIDQTFAFPRKIAGEQGWHYINLNGLPDLPSRGEEQGEILTYLQRVGGGDEFRENGEMRARWFDHNGALLREKVVASDVATLITPSVERALLLNKAYYTIVQDQDFIQGRDANLVPVQNVHQQIEVDTTAPLPPEHRYHWDIRLQQ